MLLSRHPNIEVLTETNFYPIFQPLRACYEPLSNARSLERFVGEVTSVARHIMPFPVTSRDIQARVQDRTVPGVLTAWLDLYAGHYGKTRAGEKTPRHCRHLATIAEDFPDAPILFVVRDPRDCVASGVAGLGRSMPAMIADWNGAIGALATPGDRHTLVRYEELVAAPELVLRRLCAVLGEPWDARMLDPSRTSPLFTRWHRGHERLTTPVGTQSVGRFAAMEASDVATIEHDCAPGMRLLGYAPSPPSTLRHRVGETRSVSARPQRRWERLGRADWARRLFFWRLRLRSQIWRLRTTRLGGRSREET
jgi:hypothetical protein